MKRVFTTILGALLLVTANAQSQSEPRSDKDRDRLLGQVLTVKTEAAEFVTQDGKNVEGPRMPVLSVEYDARGNRVKRVDYNRDGSVAQTIVYTYNTEGRNTGFEDYMPGLDTPRKHVYVLDASGRKTEYSIIQPNGKPADEKYLYKYNPSGFKIADELYHKTSIISRNENTYDDQGRLTAQVFYNPDGTISAKVQNTFTADGKPLERIRYDDDLVTYKVRYTYDGKGRLVETQTTGSYLDEEFNSEGHTAGKVVYVYKAKNQVKEAITYNPDGSFRERLIFDYDSQGNWTRRTRRVKSPNGKELPQQIEYRTITYQQDVTKKQS